MSIFQAAPLRPLGLKRASALSFGLRVLRISRALALLRPPRYAAVLVILFGAAKRLLEQYWRWRAAATGAGVGRRLPSAVFFETGGQSPASTGSSDSPKSKLSHGCLMPCNRGRRMSMKYEVECSPIGSGAVGTVRPARRKTLDRTDVALKGVAKDSVTNARQFRNEVDVQLSLDHPAICKLFEVFENPTHIFIATEMCFGGELFDVLSAQPGSVFGEDAAASFIGQTLQAVVYMHSKGIAHRDIKLENLVVVSKDVPLLEMKIKLIDFGYSRVVSDDGFMQTALGTHQYVAPEVLEGNYGLRCDVWSCGILLFIMLSGAEPWDEDTPDEVLQQVRRGVIEFPADSWALLQGAAELIATGMCVRNPDQRLTAQEALQSRWVQDAYMGRWMSQVTPGGTSQFQAVARFRAFGTFRRMAFYHMARRATGSEVAALGEQFRLLDKNNDGVLDLEDIKSYGDIESLGVGGPRAVEAHLRGRPVDFTEFVAACLCTEMHAQEPTCQVAFEIFDWDGDGYMSLDKLLAVVHDSEGEKATQEVREELTAFMVGRGRNANDKIFFEDFMDLLRGDGLDSL